jgi:flagellar assembly protein FliH
VVAITQMTPAKRFLFEHCFETDLPLDARTDEVEVTAEDVASESGTPATFSEDDLARAHAEGVAEGREQAGAEAAGAVERRVADTLDTLGDRLSDLLVQREDAFARAVGDATMVAATIARKMVPELYRRNAAGEIEHAVATILERMLEKPKLTVRVSEPLRDDLAERIAALAERRGFAGRVTVTADPETAEGDCRIEWAGGGAELNAADRWREIDTIIEQNLDGAPTNLDRIPDNTDTDEIPAVDTTEETDGRNPSHQELEDEHG